MARLFSDVLADMGRGQTAEELTSRLSEVVQAVSETGKVGGLTLNVKVKPNGDGSVIITDEIKSKVPEGTRPDTLFFTTSDGSLLRTDPKQEEMFSGPKAVEA